MRYGLLRSRGAGWLQRFAASWSLRSCSAPRAGSSSASLFGYGEVMALPHWSSAAASRFRLSRRLGLAWAWRRFFTGSSWILRLRQDRLRWHWRVFFRWWFFLRGRGWFLDE